MKTWSGVITTGDYLIEVTVYNERRGKGPLVKWYGTGESKAHLEPGTYETNIGKILINQITPVVDSGQVSFSIGFRGSGLPKGPFAEYLGLTD